MDQANANLTAALAPYEGYGAPAAIALSSTPSPNDGFYPEGDGDFPQANDPFSLPYGDEALQESPWIDKTDAAGERSHGGVTFNILHCHEDLARACCSADSMVTPLLHEGCTVRVLEGDFVSSARQLHVATADRVAAVALLHKLSLAPAERMEPAEVMHNGDTRVHWVDIDGRRYGQHAVWSADGLAMELTMVLEPPPTHRHYLQALQERSPAVDALLEPGVVLHDVAASSELSGASSVLPRLLRWAADASAAQGVGALQVSRVTHLTPKRGARRTRLHCAGQWRTSLSGGAPTLCMLEETVEWKYTPPSPGARARSARATTARATTGRGAVGPSHTHDDSSGWRVGRITRRTLALSERPAAGSPPLPLNVYQAAALAGSHAVLCGPVGVDDDDEEGESSVHARRRAGGGNLSDSSEDDDEAEEANLMLEIARMQQQRPPVAHAHPARGRAPAPTAQASDAELMAMLLPPVLPGMSDSVMRPKREVASAWAPRRHAAAQAPIARAAVDAVAAAMAELPGDLAGRRGMSDRQARKRELEAKVAAEVRRTLVIQRWGLLSLRVRVRGKEVLARLAKLRDAASDVEDDDEEGDEEGEEGFGDGALIDPEAREAARAYAGIKLLSDGETELDTFEMGAHLLQLQIGSADLAAVSELEGLLSDGIVFTHKSGHHGNAPSAPPTPPGLAAEHSGKAAVMEHLKGGGQLKRLRQNVTSQQPAALMVDGRTRLNFEISVAGGTDVERLQDVIEWDHDGKIKTWIRVYEPRKSQRDWLQLVAANKAGAFLELLAPNTAFASLDGKVPQVYRGAARAYEALKASGQRLGGHIAHVGRTRELSEWAWPKELMPDGDAPPPRKKGAPKPTVVQAIFIGTWRDLGAKWYGEEERVMRETAEWTGRVMTKLMWEPLPFSHPQAQVVYQRLRDKRRRTRLASRNKVVAEKIRDDRMNGNRPAWNNAQPPLVMTTGLSLKAAEKLGREEQLPRPPKTMAKRKPPSKALFDRNGVPIVR